MNDLDDRIKAALQARAASVQEEDLPPVARPGRPPRRWLAPLLAAAAVLAVAVGVSVAVTVGHGSPSRQPAAGPPPAASATATHRAARSTAGTPSTAPVVNCYFADMGCHMDSYYEPLWPFANYAQAKAWEAQEAQGGSSPWHADPGATAVFFTQNVLGFTDITSIVTSKLSADRSQAFIGVGNKIGGSPYVAAVIHLVRYGTTPGIDGPWEVVGTEDSTFTLEQPAYGSAVTSPMTVGGHITGADESIAISVLTQDGKRETIPPFPAGGDNAPWTATVPFSRTGVLIIVASTGGHTTAHERFAIQGVHTSA